MTKEPTYQELQSQLAEARQLIETIRDGEVDAILSRNRLLIVRLRELEESLRSSEAEKSLILAHTMEPIAHYDQERRLKCANGAYLQACGAQELDSVQGRTCMQFRCQGRACDPACPIARVLATGNAQQGEMSFGRRRPGNHSPPVCWQVSATALNDDQGNMVGIIEVARDVTDQRRLLNELQKAKGELQTQVQARTAQLQQRSRQLARLTEQLMQAEGQERLRLARSLHDNLQQLIAVAKFNVDIITASPDSDSWQGLAKNASQSLDRALAASRSIVLDLSPPILHQSALVDCLKWLSEWMHSNYNLNVRMEVAEGADTNQETVKRLIYEISRELLTNVVKHAGVLEAELRIARRDRNLQVVISDQGRGFNPESLHVETEDLQPGFGLFSIDQRLSYVGGSLNISSQPGLGTRCAFSVPLDFSETKKSASGPAGSARTESGGEKDRTEDRKIRVMLVDDHTVMRQGLALILNRQADMEVVAEAASGEEAVTTASKARPEVILMDYSMSGMNGAEATTIIHSRQPKIRIIGLSMYDEKPMLKAMRDAGAVDMLSKSTPAEQMLSVIRQATPE